MSQGNEILRLEGVELENEAIIDMIIYGGEVLGIIGESASGKTSLARIISGGVKSRGNIFLDGERVCRLLELQRSVAYIGAQSNCIDGLDIAQNVFLGNTSRYSGLLFVDSDRLHSEARRWLSEARMCRVDTHSDISKLNCGEKKLVEIARALSRHPKVLVLDGVFCMLEHTYRKKIEKIMDQFRRSGGAIVFLTRDFSHVREMCDRAYELRDGRAHALDTGKVLPRDVLSDTASASVYAKKNEHPMLLRAVNLCVAEKLCNVNFKLGNGEMLGIVGLSCSGIHTLGRVLYGACRVQRGRVSLRGVIIKSVKDALRGGVLYATPRFNRERLYSVEDDPSDVFILDSILSGAQRSEVDRIVESIRKIKQSGRSLILISEDIDGQIQLCDRILVFFRGRMVGEFFSRDGYCKERMLELVTGEALK